MTSYTNSLDALRELLLFPSNLSHSICSITKIPENVTKLSNGIEYCLVEITCDDGVKYGIQACGEEAIKLHKEAIKYHQEQSFKNEKEKSEEENRRTNKFLVCS